MLKPSIKKISGGSIAIDARGFKFAEFIPEDIGFTIRLSNVLPAGISSLIRRDNKVFIPGSVRDTYELGKDAKVLVGKNATATGNEYVVRTDKVFDTVPVIKSCAVSTEPLGTIGFKPLMFSTARHKLPCASEFAKISMLTGGRLAMEVSSATESDVKELTDIKTAEAEFGRGLRYCPQSDITVVKKVSRDGKVSTPDFFKAHTSHYWRFAIGNAEGGSILTPVVNDDLKELTLENGMHDTYVNIPAMHSKAYESAIMSNRDMEARCAAFANALKAKVEEAEDKKKSAASVIRMEEERERLLKVLSAGGFTLLPRKVEA